jgi:hypothetical protein
MSRTVFDAIDQARNFGRHEFPETVEGLRPEFIDRLQKYREALGRAIHPSPNPAGWVRRTGRPDSRHHVSNADAGDVFPAGDVLDAFLVACRFFGGVGIYYDTRFRDRPWPMLHLDMRPGRPLVWCRYEGDYYYPHHSEEHRNYFWCLAWQHAEGEL